MAEPFVGQIIATGFNFAPVGWQRCDGSLLSISENSTLYNLIGTTYGGDGVSTFAVPNLQSRAAIGLGTGSGLSNYPIGSTSGFESVTLTTQNMPSHQHTPMINSGSGNASDPGPTVVPADPAGGGAMYATVTTPTSLEPNAIGQTTGAGNQPHENRQPLLAINYIISLSGIFPSQS